MPRKLTILTIKITDLFLHLTCFNGFGDKALPIMTEETKFPLIAQLCLQITALIVKEVHALLLALCSSVALRQQKPRSGTHSNIISSVTLNSVFCCVPVWDACQNGGPQTVFGPTEYFWQTANLFRQITRVGTLIVAIIYLQLIQNRYMFRSFTVLQCSHQH